MIPNREHGSPLPIWGLYPFFLVLTNCQSTKTLQEMSAHFLGGIVLGTTHTSWVEDKTSSWLSMLVLEPSGCQSVCFLSGSSTIAVCRLCPDGQTNTVVTNSFGNDDHLCGKCTENKLTFMNCSDPRLTSQWALPLFNKMSLVYMNDWFASECFRLCVPCCSLRSWIHFWHTRLSSAPNLHSLPTGILQTKHLRSFHGGRQWAFLHPYQPRCCAVHVLSVKCTHNNLPTHCVSACFTCPPGFSTPTEGATSFEDCGESILN